MEPKESLSNIPGTFNGKRVFITGASGFVGKVLLEKLLRSCPGISEVFILLRPTEKIDCSSKLAKLLRSNVFDLMKSQCPDALNKVRSIQGDVTCDNLGLNEQDLQLLQNEVSFVFHCAASVRFEDNPKTTLEINLLGVKNVLDVCRSMKKIEVLVHVSTAYSFCNLPIIGEELYQEITKPSSILEILKWMSKEQLKAVCEHLTKGRPSLYQYSKAMAEILIAEKRGNLPVVIVRPSIITAARNEPFPGWIDNYNGPSGFIALSCKGIIKTLLVKKGVHADWIPVDSVVNTLIAAAHFVSLQRYTNDEIQHLSTSSGVPIINCVCSVHNSIDWSQVTEICIPLLHKYPSLDIYRIPGGTVTASYTVYSLCKTLSHYLPAFLIDVFMFLARREMRNVRTYRRIHGVLNHLQLYTTHGFVFVTTNMDCLVKRMTPTDNRDFPIDHNSLNWFHYIEDYVHGVRRYFLKEKDESLPMARRKLFRLQRIYHCGKIVSIGLLLVFLLNCTKTKRIHFPLHIAFKALQLLPSLLKSGTS